MKLKSIMLAALLLAVLFSGCIGDKDKVAPTPTPVPTPEPTPTVTLEQTSTPTPEQTPTAVAKEPETHKIWIDKWAFTPRNPTIYVGDVLEWNNNQGVRKMRPNETGDLVNVQKTPVYDFVLVSEDGLWENQTLILGKKFRYTFNTSGNYTYYCPGFEGTMRGTVTVLP
ncbi:MAG: plastocyanin/azurin family copper-binding protein [Euryarchaeota archaeon]|nr:plastocyanin/azurin family copper-binding protein [Euryarchaeota archaeon]